MSFQGGLYPKESQELLLCWEEYLKGKRQEVGISFQGISVNFIYPHCVVFLPFHLALFQRTFTRCKTITVLSFFD